MSKQKSTPDLSKVKIKMSDLVNVALKTEGLFAEALFGWSVDRQIAKIGDLAKQAVDYKIGEELTLIRSKRMSIEDEYRRPYEGQEHTEENDAEYKKKINSDKAYVDLYKKEQALWDSVIEDFEFTPVKVKIPADVAKKIKKVERMIVYRDKPYPVETYAALGYLVDNNYIIETA
jgi:hypothetical protein